MKKYAMVSIVNAVTSIFRRFWPLKRAPRHENKCSSDGLKIGFGANLLLSEKLLFSE
jgi:hypothetical protein